MQRKKVLVIGLGRFGTAVVDTLWRDGAEVLAVDRDEPAVDAVKNKTDLSIIGDGTDPVVLERLGASDADTAIVTFGEYLEGSVLAVAALKQQFKLKNVVARASTKRRADVLRAVGADRVVQLEEEMGHRVATEILTPVASDLIDFAAQYRVVPWVASGPLVGKPLKDCGLRQRYALNVLGYRKARAPKTERLTSPGPDYVIEDGDTLLLVGEEANVSRFVGAEGE